MIYGPEIVNELKSAGIRLLRFPGGNWGEGRILSYEQLDHFSTLLYKVGADGMIQARLSNPIDLSGKPASLPARANLAAQPVEFMNYPFRALRTGISYTEQIHPLKLCTISHE